MKNENINDNVKVRVEDYPVLQGVLWDYHDNMITYEDAFYFYETRFAYLQTDLIEPTEAQFLAFLVEHYGNGCVLTA